MTKAATDIEILKRDVKYLKDSVDKLTIKVDEIHDTLITGEGKIGNLNKAVFGNGKSGLIDRVDGMEKKMAMYAGVALIVALLIQIAAPVIMKSLFS